MITTETNSIFQLINGIVQGISHKWSGYQMALLNQAGGDQTREKDLWHKIFLLNFFKL